MPTDLTLFVREALARGIPRESIRENLLAARWPADQVRTALDTFAEIDFPVPIPRPKPYVSAREAFIYLVVFTTLYTCAVSLIQLLFQFIHHFFPDPAASVYAIQSSMRAVRWSTSALLIAFPLYFWLSRRTFLAIRRDPEKRLSKIRKWLTYLTLFAAAGALAVDLMTLVYYFLDGELTTRFLLKVLAVGGVAGGILGYYLWDLRTDERNDELAAEVDATSTARESYPARLAAAAAALAVVASLVGGLLLAGPPQTTRLVRLDDRREGDLQAIAAAIDAYWSQNERLPSGIESLPEQRISPARSARDPVSDELYEYRITGEQTYELCATFDREDSQPQQIYRPRPNAKYFWSHDAGRVCFHLEVWEQDS